MKMKKIFISGCLLVLVASGLFADADHVVISEFATHDRTKIYSGLPEESNEFIELFNPTSVVVDISSWTVEYAQSGSEFDNSAQPSKTSNLVLQLPRDTTVTIPPKGHFLIANTTGYTGTVLPDATWYAINRFSSAGGHIRIRKPLSPGDTNYVEVDRVGWGSAVYPEGAACLKQKDNDESIKRLPEAEDTDNNLNDFYPSTSRDPQNSKSTEVKTDKIIVAMSLPRKPFCPDLGEGINISFSIPKEYKSRIKIFDIKGRLVKLLIDDEPGWINSARWDGKDEMLAFVQPGSYIVHLQAIDDSGKSVANKSGVAVVATPLQ